MVCLVIICYDVADCLRNPISPDTLFVVSFGNISATVSDSVHIKTVSVMENPPNVQLYIDKEKPSFIFQCIEYGVQ